MTDTVFNYDKTDYAKPLLLLGQRPGLFDTVNRHYPEIWKLYKAQKSLDWDENEFDYSSCNAEFKSCTRATYDMMIKTLAWQWEADSVASRAIAPVLAPFITSSELWAAWQRISDNEVVHAATYSEIVRNSFDDPSVILDEILRVQEAHDRLSEVAKAFAVGYEAAHKYAIGQLPNDQDTYNAVFMTIVALLCMERIQFMASFAVTFAICDTGLFQPIGKAIQKIAQDELEIHAELDRVVLLNELKTERGQTAFAQCREQIEKMIEEVVESELRWINYLFSEGRELVGMNADRLSAWTLYCAKDVYQLFGLTTDKYTLPAHNPLKFMEKWLNISKTQASPQEQDIAAYKVGVMRRTDENLDDRIAAARAERLAAEDAPAPVPAAGEDDPGKVLKARLLAAGADMNRVLCLTADDYFQRTGQPLTEEWMVQFRAERNALLERELQAIPHIHAAVQAIHTALGGQIACASGADRIKIELQIEKVGLTPYFAGRIFSGHETPRSKPFPDVYLAAAAALGVEPTRCAVVEDTVTGVTAGVVAGATVFGYSPGGPEHATPQALRAAGATQVFTSMADLPALLAAYNVSALTATTP